VAACHVEEVALMLVKDQFEGIVLHTSGTGNKGEVVETFGDGFEFI
jgi:L-asparaginase/Glu-tRNA(Gln) amidotransferase subunit D